MTAKRRWRTRQGQWQAMSARLLASVLDHAPGLEEVALFHSHLSRCWPVPTITKVARLTRELNEALEQQAATADLLPSPSLEL